jgi:hypothetical protein
MKTNHKSKKIWIPIPRDIHDRKCGGIMFRYSKKIISDIREYKVSTIL